MARPAWRSAVIVCLCTFAYLWWIAAAHFSLALNDEGIYLDGGLRVARGEMPYRDFFALTGPGTYALEAASLRAFGETLAAARLPVIFDIALMAGCLFWLVSKLSHRTAAIFAVLAYVAIETAGETSVLANHRWDSAAWATLAATLVVAALESGHPRLLCLLAGVSVGLASWCTPTVALAAIALGVCLIVFRKSFWSFTAGVAIAFAAVAAWLAARGAFTPMLNALVWTASNYSGANHVPYGWVTGGYLNLLRGLGPGQMIVTAFLLLFLTLPATLPFASAIWLWKGPPQAVVVLLAAGAALVISAYPMWDLIHLQWVSAPFYALAAPLAARIRFGKTVAVIVLLGAASFAGVALHQRLSETARANALGKLHGRPEDLEVLANLQAQVRPSDTLFVFPFRPLFYFLTGAHNPTRYSFLNRIMFPESDEQTALDELRARPPRWVVYMDVPPEAFVRIWPSADPRRARMPAIEAFLHENYSDARQWADFQLLQRTTP